MIVSSVAIGVMRACMYRSELEKDGERVLQVAQYMHRRISRPPASHAIQSIFVAIVWSHRCKDTTYSHYKQTLTRNYKLLTEEIQKTGVIIMG